MRAVRWPPAEPPVTHDEVGVDAVLVGVLADEREGPLAVDEVVGQGGERAQAVVGVEADPPVGREVVEQRQTLLALVADDPRAAVDLEEGGAPIGGAALGGQVDVEALAPAARPPELDVLDAAHALAPEGEGEHHLRHGDPGAGRLAGDLDHGVAERDAGVTPLQDHAEEPHPRHRRQGQTQPTGPGREGAEPHEQAHQHDLERQVEGRQLDGEPRREEARGEQHPVPGRPPRIDGEQQVPHAQRQQQPRHRTSLPVRRARGQRPLQRGPLPRRRWLGAPR